MIIRRFAPDLNLEMDICKGAYVYLRNNKAQGRTSGWLDLSKKARDRLERMHSAMQELSREAVRVIAAETVLEQFNTRSK